MDVQCHMGPIIPAALVTSQLDSDVVTHSHPFILHLLRISQRRFGAFAVLHCWRCYGQTTNHYLNKQQQEPRCWPMFDRNWELCPKSHEGEEVSNRTCTKPQRQAYRRDSDSEQPPANLSGCARFPWQLEADGRRPVLWPPWFWAGTLSHMVMWQFKVYPECTFESFLQGNIRKQIKHVSFSD